MTTRTILEYAVLVGLLAVPGSASAQSGQVTVQTAPLQNGGISTRRLACNEWDHCIEVPGFRIEAGSGWNGQIAGPMPNPAIYDGNRPSGGLEFTRRY